MYCPLVEICVVNILRAPQNVLHKTCFFTLESQLGNHFLEEVVFQLSL